MFRTALCLLPLLVPFAPALAQQAVDAGVIRAYIEGCLQTSQPQGSDAAQEFCKCTAKLVLPAQGAPSGDRMESMMQCLPAMGEAPGGG